MALRAVRPAIGSVPCAVRPSRPIVCSPLENFVESMVMIIVMRCSSRSGPRSSPTSATWSHYGLVAAALPLMILPALASCSRTEPDTPKSPVSIGDSVSLPPGVAGTVALWLMNPGTCDIDTTYATVPEGSTAVIVDLCFARSVATRDRWYARLTFPGVKPTQGVDNAWLPVDELTPLSKAKPTR